MNITMTIDARLRSGLYSDVNAIAFGIAPPRPRPVRKRQTMRLVSESAVTVKSVHKPKNSVQNRMTGLRPRRSATGPEASAPSVNPNKPIPNTGPKAPGRSCQARLSVGATYPIAWASKPSMKTTPAQSAATMI